MAGLHEEKHEQDKKQLTQGDPHAVPVREEKKLPAQRGEDRSGIHHQLRLGDRGNILSYRELVMEEEAKKWFAIMPTKKRLKVIRAAIADGL